MKSSLALIGIDAALFAWTNVDDLILLIGFFSDPRVPPRHVVIGQYVGFGMLYGVSVLASLLAIVVPQAYIGLLGLAPILVGITKLYALWWGAEPDIELPDRHSAASEGGGRNILTVAMATLANGGDNLSAYTPWFATRSGVEVAAAGAVFAVMTALWCALGHWLVHHPALGAPIRRYGRRTLPLLLIGFGVSILYCAGTLRLL